MTNRTDRQKKTGRPDGKAPVRSASASPARVAALEALLDVQISDAYAGLALSRRISASKLNASDRRLMTELFYGVLENRICLDYILSLYMERPCQDDVTLQILRMGVYQLVFMDKIPENAACNESVMLSKRMARGAMSGLVNAVLRSLVRDRSRIVYPEEPIRNLAVRTSFPEWLAEKLIKEYGMEFAAKLMKHREKRHAVTIRPNLMQFADAEAFEEYLADQGFEWEKSIVPGAYRISGGFAAQHIGFRTGQYSIMGEASMLAVQALSLKGGQQVLDCCAAPGGKSCYIAETLHGSGRVHAWDFHEHRVKLIGSAAKRLHLENIRLRVQDARQLVEDQIGQMHAVLVDAPCSGLGDYLSKPDIKYRVTQEEVSELHKTQVEILDTCCRYVRPGGVLVYSTCTLFKEENEDTVREFLKKHPEFELKGLEDTLPETFRGNVSDSMLTLYPHIHHVDGFFIAHMVRKKRA